MLQERADDRETECTHTVMRAARWLPNGKGWICADDDHPGCHYRIEEAEAPCREAEYWKGRFIGMRRTYRERFNEGMTMQEWHAAHCAAFVASKQMQTAIAEVVADIDNNYHTISSADVARRLRPLLDKGPETPPSCAHDAQSPR